MGILEKLKITAHREPGIKDFCIQTIRFRKLLENARTLLALLEDGNEKVIGEYILDRHYVTSLIDDALAGLGRMIYDACVLVPEYGKTFYRLYDAHKARAAELISPQNTHGKNRGGSATPLSDPEYELLSDALTWMNGEASEPGATVIDFMKLVSGRVIEKLTAGNDPKVDAVIKNTVLSAPGGHMFLLDLWEDAVALPVRPRSLEDINSVPLKLLLMDACGGNVSPVTGDKIKTATWIAAFSEYRLNLRTVAPDCRFYLEASVSGHGRSDFIFIFAAPAIPLKNILPRGFHTATTDHGQLAWTLDAAPKSIEDSLISIGCTFF